MIWTLEEIVTLIKLTKQYEAIFKAGATFNNAKSDEIEALGKRMENMIVRRRIFDEISAFYIEQSRQRKEVSTEFEQITQAMFRRTEQNLGALIIEPDNTHGYLDYVSALEELDQILGSFVTQIASSIGTLTGFTKFDPNLAYAVKTAQKELRVIRDNLRRLELFVHQEISRVKRRLSA